MSLLYQAKQVKFSNGEVSGLLLDAEGLPLPEPALWVMRKLRVKNAANTILSKLRAVAVLYSWLDKLEAEKKGRGNIKARFTKEDYFNQGELLDLKDWCSRNFEVVDSVPRIRPVKIIRVPAGKTKISRVCEIKTPSVKTDSTYYRMTFISQYMSWLAIYASNISKQRVDYYSRIEIRQMIAAFKEERPAKSGKRKWEPKSLSLEEQKELEKFFSLNSKCNPFCEEGVRIRNNLIYLLLYHLGLRVGELLGIKMEDIDRRNNVITIHRRPDDVEDIRSRQARQKTLARDLPLKPSLMKLVNDYIVKQRSKVKNKDKTRYLFISHSRATFQSGKPLSISSLNKMFTKVTAFSDVLATVTPHMLRHTWNENFSNWIDSLSPEKRPSKEEEAQMRREIMGWEEGSMMDQHYNKRHIQKVAGKALVKMMMRLSHSAIKEKKSNRAIRND